MQVELDRFLESLGGDLMPIRELALRFRPSGFEETSEDFALSHRPRIAQLAYALRLYKPLPIEIIASYEQLHGIKISLHYLTVIQKLNGVHAF